METIRFGEGHLAIGSVLTIGLTITFLDPARPQELGSSSTSWPEDIYTDRTIYITEDTKTLRRVRDEALQLENREDKTILCGDYIFDFTKYDKRSVDVLVEQINCVIQCRLRLIAC